MNVLAELKIRGLIRHLGVANVTSQQFTEAQKIVHWLFHRAFGWSRVSSNSEVHGVQYVESQISQIAFNRLDELMTRECRKPRFC
jgi:aryl-alcohol dehydrogenase-like predicted oxidoreductase